MNELVEITKEEYSKLLEDQRWLQALESAGVDNWEGYDWAVDLFNGNYEDIYGPD